MQKYCNYIFAFYSMRTFFLLFFPSRGQYLVIQGTQQPFVFGTPWESLSLEVCAHAKPSRCCILLCVYSFICCCCCCCPDHQTDSRTFPSLLSAATANDRSSINLKCILAQLLFFYRVISAPIHLKQFFPNLRYIIIRSK